MWVVASAPAASDARSPPSVARRRRAVVSSATLPGAKSRPLRPSSITSGSAPMREASTGMPCLSASREVRLNVSGTSDGTTVACTPRSSSGSSTGSNLPIMRSSSPGTPAAARRSDSA